MATSYRPRVLPVVACIRGLVLATLARVPASGYRLPDQSHVESRETWDDGTDGLTATPDPIPGDWIELT